MRGYIKWQRIIPEIKMSRKGEGFKAYLLVEGETDVRFFSNIVDEERCKIISIDGKSNVITAINAVNNQKIEKVLAVIDSDFDSILDKHYEIENLFFTDTHDVETLILKTDSIKKFLNEYADKEKLKKIEKIWDMPLKEKVTEAASKIGYVKLVSAKNKMNLSFNGLDYSRIMDEGLNINTKECVRQATALSSKYRGYQSEILSEAYMLESQGYDKWKISCGHDITIILSQILSDNYGRESIGNISNNGLTSKQIERALRTAYDYRRFVDTELYKSIVQWQEKEQFKIIDVSFNEEREKEMSYAE